MLGYLKDASLRDLDNTDGQEIKAEKMGRVGFDQPIRVSQL